MFYCQVGRSMASIVEYEVEKMCWMKPKRVSIKNNYRAKSNYSAINYISSQNDSYSLFSKQNRYRTKTGIRKMLIYTTSKEIKTYPYINPYMEPI